MIFFKLFTRINNCIHSSRKYQWSPDKVEFETKLWYKDKKYNFHLAKCFLKKKSMSISLCQFKFSCVQPKQFHCYLSFSVDEANRWSAMRIRFALLVSVICLKKLYSISTCVPKFRRWGWNDFIEMLYKASSYNSISNYLFRYRVQDTWFLVVDSVTKKRFLVVSAQYYIC